MVPQWNMDFSKVKVPVGCIVMELFFFFVLEFYQRRTGRTLVVQSPGSGSRGVRGWRERSRLAH